MRNAISCSIFFGFLFAAILLFTTCQREWDNPFDENADPMTWAPQDFQITNLSLTEKKLTWTHHGDNRIDGFKIDRKKGEEPWQTEYRTFSKETRNWTDTEIVPQPSIIYSYRLYAYAGKQISGTKLMSVTVVFSEPTNLTIEKTSEKSYVLSWNDNSIGEQGFKIDRRIENGQWFINYGTVAANQTTFIDTNVFRSFNIDYRVYGYFNEFETVKLLANTNAELSPPSDLQLTGVALNYIILNWNDNSNGEDGFKIERKYADDDWNIIALLPRNSKSFSDDDFQLNTNVYYRVYAYVGQYNSSSATVDFNSAIPAPQNFNVVFETLSKVKLTWQDHSIGEEGFRIDRKTGNGEWQTGFIVTNPNVTLFENVVFPLNETISYRICAFARGNNSAILEKNISTQIPAPQNFNVVFETLSKVKLTWQDHSYGEEGFRIDRKTGNGEWQTGFIITNPNVTQFENVVFPLNETISYRICAFARGNNSAILEKTITTQIPAPQDLVITQTGNGAFKLNWTEACYGEDGFKIDRKVGTGAWQYGYGSVGNNVTTFTDNLLQGQNTYIYRVYTYKGSETSVFTEKEITMLFVCGSNVIYAGKTYNTILIGTQCWIKQNLDIGNMIQGSTNPSDNGIIEKYCYNNAVSNCNIYGGLYQWDEMMQYSISQGARGICPEGWHIPTDAEWTLLTTFLGGESVAGGKMKETGTSHWSSPNTGATNSSGFKGLPGGNRYTDGSFYNQSDFGYWWSSTQGDASSSWRRYLYYYYANVFRGSHNKAYGFSVRCLKD